MRLRRCGRCSLCSLWFCEAVTNRSQSWRFRQIDTNQTIAQKEIFIELVILIHATKTKSSSRSSSTALITFIPMCEVSRGMLTESALTSPEVACKSEEEGGKA
ncbi:uncharacterized protein LOC117207497 [Bombus bifarius]|uniref:Uncharacterized protein LOC117207497 n=1 Tax=Bombus bifarius TaxID=103933 RepID=A0A6P8LZ05_9HYME|nr:uncharacterized protein LOC117164989 [Bombus vancouverensis nearcticus]XP_033303689.1 uncharacterized protein LOC117207497 [Bombus bifarius]